MGHVRGAPCHPQTQGKIERWHQTLKNRILLENYYLPGDLEARIDTFVDHYNSPPVRLLASHPWMSRRAGSNGPTACRLRCIATVEFVTLSFALATKASSYV